MPAALLAFLPQFLDALPEIYKLGEKAIAGAHELYASILEKIQHAPDLTDVERLQIAAISATMRALDVAGVEEPQ